jgi:hypothetical protein
MYITAHWLLFNSLLGCSISVPREKTLYISIYIYYNIYINKDGNPSTISTRHVEANVNTQEENQNNQNSSNEVEDLRGC